MFTRTISVLTHRPDEVPAYLYEHTREESRVFDGQSTRVTLVTTADTAERATFLAQCQADRLWSGWHAAELLQDSEV